MGEGEREDEPNAVFVVGEGAAEEVMSVLRSIRALGFKTQLPHMVTVVWGQSLRP